MTIIDSDNTGTRGKREALSRLLQIARAMDPLQGPDSLLRLLPSFQPEEEFCLKHLDLLRKLCLPSPIDDSPTYYDWDDKDCPFVQLQMKIPQPVLR